MTGTDTFTLTVANTNDAPTAIALSGTAIAENSAAGTVIGSLTATDADSGDTPAFSLVTNPGQQFTIANGKLVVAKGADLDFEETTAYSVTIRATDEAGATVEQNFTIDITDITRDRMNGTKGNDHLTAGASGNILDGRRGNDTLKGGDGADTFVFGKGYGRDVVIEFDRGDGDRIDLSGAAGIRNFRDLVKNHAEDIGKDVIITADDGSVLVLKGIDLDDLGKDSFMF